MKVSEQSETGEMLRGVIKMQFALVPPSENQAKS